MFQTKSTIQKVSTLSNNCLAILIHTGDTSRFKPEQLAEMFRMVNEEKEFWVAFSELEVRQEDIKIEENLDVGEQKSPHKRVYDIILAYCKVKDGNFDKTRELYKKLMNNIADQYLNKIRDIEEANKVINN